MKTVMMLALIGASVGISLTVGLITSAYGQKVDNQTVTKEHLDALEALINYCFQHADRANPIQDLVDKGFLSPAFKGETCISIREQYDIIAKVYAIQQAKKEKDSLAYQTMQKNEFNKKMNTTDKYHECAINLTKTQEECNSIGEGIK